MISFGLSLTLAILLNALLVVAKGSNDGLRRWMEAATGHHWTTHGSVILAIFLMGGFALARLRLDERITPRQLAMLIGAAVGMSSLVIAGFYLSRFHT